MSGFLKGVAGGLTGYGGASIAFSQEWVEPSFGYGLFLLLLVVPALHIVSARLEANRD